MKKIFSILLVVFVLLSFVGSFMTTGVVSNAEDTIYEIDFSSISGVDDLKEKGWKFLNGDDCYKVEDGYLYVGSTATSYVRAILPEELSEYGNYDIKIEAKMISSANSSRWFGLVYRMQNMSNGQYYPYYHMCVRDNSSTTNGVEFAERTSSNAWNVKLTKATDFSSSKEEFHTYEIKAYNKTIQYLIDDEQIIYCTSANFNTTGKYTKGGLGITADSCVVAIKKITVTAQNELPEKAAKVVELTNISHDQENLVNPIANVDKINSENDDLSNVSEAFIDCSAISDLTGFLTACKEKTVIPVLKLDNEDQAAALKSSVTDSGIKDIVVVSSSAEVLTKVKKTIKKISCGRGLIIKSIDNELTEETANEVRKTINQATASFCILDESYCSKNNVKKLQKLAVAVWADVTETSNENVSFAKVLTAGVNGVVSNSSKNVSAFIGEYFEEYSMTRLPLDIGHRGAVHEAQDNSIESYKKAIAGGADVVETDVYLTKDGEVIVNHDGTLNSTTNYTGSKTVTQMTLEEIKQYNFKYSDGTLSEEKVPTLNEMLAALKDDDVFIFIELKQTTLELCNKVAEIVAEYDFEDRVDVITFSSDAIYNMQKANPGMSTGFLYMYSTGDAGDMADSLDAIYSLLKSSQTAAATVNPQNNVVSHEYIQAATDRGMTVWPWTYDTSSNNYGFFVCSDGITTNDPGWFENMVNELTSILPSEMVVGSTKEIKAKTTTYVGTESDVEGDLIIKVVDGSEFVTVSGNKVKATSEGTATILVGYKTKTTDDEEYVVYSEPITVNVVPKGTEVDDSDYDDFGVKEKKGCGSVISGGTICVMLLGAAMLLKAKSKKQ